MVSLHAASGVSRAGGH